MTFCQLTRHPVVIENGNIAIRTGPSRRVEWWYSHSSMTTGGRDIRRNVIKSAFLSLSVLRHLTFRRISLRPVFVEESKYHHSNRLVEASRMVVFSFFYNYWTSRYLTKRHKISIFVLRHSNISASSGCRRMFLY